MLIAAGFYPSDRLLFGALERILPVVAQQEIKCLKPFCLAGIWRPNENVDPGHKIKMFAFAICELPIKLRYG